MRETPSSSAGPPAVPTPALPTPAVSSMEASIAARIEALEAENATLKRLLEDSQVLEIERERQTRLLELTENLGRTGNLVWQVGQPRVYCSPALCRLLNRSTSANELSWRTLLRRIIPAHRPIFFRALRNTFDNGFDRLARIDARVGQVNLPLRVVGFAERKENNEIARLTLIVRDDATGLAPAPRTFHEDTMLQRIMDATPDGLLLFDMRDQTMIDANDRFCELSGYRREELIGKTEEQVQLWVDQDLRRQTYLAVAEKRSHPNLEVAVRRKDGTIVETLIAVRALHADGTDIAVVNVRDVGDYKHTLRALADSESRFAQAFKEAPLAALIVRRSDNRVLDVNDAYSGVTDLTNANVIDQPLQKLLDWVEPDDRAAYVNACCTATDRLPVTFRRPSGSAFPALVSSRLTQFQGDECAIVFLQDISARTDAEQRFAQALNTNPDGAFLVRLGDNAIVEVNEAFTQLTGYEPTEVIGRSPIDVGLWADPGRRDEFFAALEKGPVRDFDAQLTRRDGYVLPITISATRSHSGDGAWLVVNMHDVTRERDAERVLRASQERFEKLFRTAPLAIGLYRVSDNTIVDVNPAYSALFGPDPASLRGRPIDLRSMWPIEEQFDQFLERLLELNEVRDFEATLAANTGTFYALVSARALRLDGEPHVIFYVSNMDEVRQMQEQLQHRQKLEAIGQLAGGVAHDFNNLLSGIQGFTELAMLQEDLHETTRGYTRQILNTVQRAAQLTKQMLIFARRDPPQLKPVDLHDVIHNTVALLEHSVDRRVQITRHLASPNPMVLGDASQIENALLNLCINARDAMPEGGQISITTGLVDLALADIRQRNLDIPPGSYLRLTISDTGSGMTPDVREHMFDPFFTTKEAGHGTGLGLAAVWGMLRSHNGGIHVETALDVGTSFQLFFKPSAQVESAPVVSPVQQLILGSGRVLLVDDEPTLRDLVATMLNTLGYDVVTANDGEDAFRIYTSRTQDFDLVLLDMTMPRMNGHDTLIAMLGVNPRARVLLMSGYVHSDDLNDSLARGALGVLHKPFDLSTLSLQVSAAMTRRRTVRR